MDNKLFNIEKMTTGHYALFFQNIMLLCDPANEDYYDKDDAEYLFDEFVKENCGEQWQLTILSALDCGFEYDEGNDTSTNQIDAENYLIKNQEAIFTQCELHCSASGQNYSYKNHSVTGDLFDFSHNGEYYYIGGDEFEPVEWFDIPNTGSEERANYIFVFDIIVYDGEVLKLYDYFA